MSIGQGFVNSGIKHHYSKAKFLKGIWVYLQSFVRDVVDKSWKVA